jgi:hypothetical protein
MKTDRLQRHALGLLVGFGVQFLAGMTLNLFVTLPKVHSGTNGKNYFASSGHGLIWSLSGGGGVALTIHVYIAVALFLGCVGLFIRGLKLDKPVWTWSGGIAALFTLGALFNGLSFIDYNHDVSSMIMASCWLIAVFSLIIGLLKFANQPAQKTTNG